VSWDRPRALVAVDGLCAIEVLGASAVEGLVRVHGWALMCEADECLLDALRARGAVEVLAAASEGEYRLVWIPEKERKRRGPGGLSPAGDFWGAALGLVDSTDAAILREIGDRIRWERVDD
jgi:hypothetical protein